MISFIDVNSVKPKEEKTSKRKMERFIRAFNTAIQRNVFSLNTGLDGSFLPELNTEEFNLCVEAAQKRGWRLTRSDDNYQTTTYHLIKG